MGTWVSITFQSPLLCVRFSMIKLNVHTQCHFSVSPLPSLRSKSLTFLALAITIVWSVQNDTVSPNIKNSQYILSVHYVQSTLTTALYHYLIKPPNNLKVLMISLFYRWRKKLRKVKLLSDITELQSGTPRIPAQADRLQSLTLFLCLNSLMFPIGQS